MTCWAEEKLCFQDPCSFLIFWSLSSLGLEESKMSPRESPWNMYVAPWVYSVFPGGVERRHADTVLVHQWALSTWGSTVTLDRIQKRWGKGACLRLLPCMLARTQASETFKNHLPWVLTGHEETPNVWLEARTSKHTSLRTPA